MMRPEDRLQARCRMYLDAALPTPGFWSSIAHERKQTLAQGAQQKARGVRRGLPDIAIFYCAQFIAIELKCARNLATLDQQAFGRAMLANGFSWIIVRSVVELHLSLVTRGVPIAPIMLATAHRHDEALAVAEPKRSRSTVAVDQKAKPSASKIARVRAMRSRMLF